MSSCGSSLKLTRRGLWYKRGIGWSSAVRRIALWSLSRSEPGRTENVPWAGTLVSHALLVEVLVGGVRWLLKWQNKRREVRTTLLFPSIICMARTATTKLKGPTVFLATTMFSLHGIQLKETFYTCNYGWEHLHMVLQLTSSKFPEIYIFLALVYVLASPSFAPCRFYPYHHVTSYFSHLQNTKHYNLCCVLLARQTSRPPPLLLDFVRPLV